MAHAVWEATTQPLLAGAEAGAAGQYPVEAACTLLYSLAIMREHGHPLSQLIAQQLAALDGPQCGGPLEQHQRFRKQAEQVGVQSGPKCSSCQMLLELI
jgi:hypothetical protein